MRIAETAYPLPDGRVLTIRSAEPRDAASLALHASLGFEVVSRDGEAVTMVRNL